MGDILPEPYQNEPQFEPRNPLVHPAGVPDVRLGGLMQEHIPSLVVRDGSSTSSASSSSSTQQASGGSNIVTPAVVGTIVPLVIAVVVIIFLHRRHVKKLRQEDAEDKHGSLDFGLGEGRRPQQSKTRWKKQPPPPAPEMTDLRNALRKERGMSLDLGQNPYLLPPGLNHSRESLHSMSRSTRLGDDKYQRTDFIPDDGSIRSPSVRRGRDDSSSFSGSTRFRNDADSSRSLIHNGAGLPARPAPPPKAYSPAPPERTTSPNPANLLAPISQEGRESMVSTTGNTAAFRASNDYLSAYIRGNTKGQETNDGKKEDTRFQAPVVVTEREVVETPKSDVRPAAAPLPAIVMNDAPLDFGRLSDYSDHRVPPPEPYEEPQRPDRTTSMPPTARDPQLPQLNVVDYDSQTTTPQERSREPSTYGDPDHSYTPEDRSRETSTYGNSQQPSAAHSREQSRIHHNQYDDESDYYDPEDTYSVYDHYNDDGHDPRRLTWGMRPLPPEDPSDNPEQRANRIRSFYKEYFEESGKPGGSPMAQYYDGSEEFYDDYYYGEEEYYPPRGMSAAGGRNRAMSNGSYMRPGPRAFSSASGRYGMPPPRGGPRMPPKKRAPPPKALNELPTPHKLKDDSFLIDMAVDFAPPDKARFQRAGTPNSSRGGQRPYSPSVRAFTPLQSSYDDLAVLPSPHLLRKSGTFTGLDFAPPGRVHVPGDSMSETGSIRSARSGISRLHEQSIRQGAYRVSRIPRGVAGTRDELETALKPRMDIGRQ